MKRSERRRLKKKGKTAEILWGTMWNSDGTIIDN